MLFGYGSLMSPESLRRTVPAAVNIRPAYIKGFTRAFNKAAGEGWTTTNLDLAGIPFCAVNVAPSQTAGRVNGVVFEIGRDDLPALCKRERGYDLVETPAYHFADDKSLGACLVFSSRVDWGKYVFGEPAQERYTQLCLDAAKQLGEEFYHEFLTTTYIGERPLHEIPELVVPNLSAQL